MFKRCCSRAVAVFAVDCALARATGSGAAGGRGFPIESVFLPLACEEAGDDHIVVPKAASDVAFFDKSELPEELASLTIPLGGQAGDPVYLQLIEGVSQNTLNEARGQPITADRGKTHLYVPKVRLIVAKHHPANQVVIRIDNADGLARSPLNITPDLIPDPLGNERGKGTRDQLQS
jgi:hypothetical protein